MVVSPPVSVQECEATSVQMPVPVGELMSEPSRAEADVVSLGANCAVQLTARPTDVVLGVGEFDAA